MNGMGKGAYKPALKPSSAAKFSSKGDASVRTNTQIKFLYYPQSRYKT